MFKKDNLVLMEGRNLRKRELFGFQRVKWTALAVSGGSLFFWWLTKNDLCAYPMAIALLVYFVFFVKETILGLGKYTATKITAIKKSVSVVSSYEDTKKHFKERIHAGTDGVSEGSRA